MAGIFDRLLGRSAPEQRSPDRVYADAGSFSGFDDPYLARFMLGHETSAGEWVSVETALKNPAVLRAVSLISYSVGMLPTYTYRVQADEDRSLAKDHPLYKLLLKQPNTYQSAFDFKMLMQQRSLTKGDGYALIIRSPDLRTGKKRPTALVPLDPDRTEPIQNVDWTVSYKYNPMRGGQVTYPSSDILHLRGLSLDGIRGVSLVKQAAEAIGLARGAERAAARLFKQGILAGGSIKMQPGSKPMSQPAFERLKQQLEELHSGANNAHKWLILEEGAEAQKIAHDAQETQLIESRKMQTEEIARVFGTPRPLLMMDDTSWGTGVVALMQIFVTFGLNPWFTAWNQAIERSALDDAEKGVVEVAFDASELLNGSILDQSTFFSRALGSGGGKPFLTQNEVRTKLRYNKRSDDPEADSLKPAAKPSGGQNSTDSSGNANDGQTGTTAAAA
jgi:HK97 family phage portal protein